MSTAPKLQAKINNIHPTGENILTFEYRQGIID